MSQLARDCLVKMNIEEWMADLVVMVKVMSLQKCQTVKLLYKRTLLSVINLSGWDLVRVFFELQQMAKGRKVKGTLPDCKFPTSLSHHIHDENHLFSCTIIRWRQKGPMQDFQMPMHDPSMPNIAWNWFKWLENERWKKCVWWSKGWTLWCCPQQCYELFPTLSIFISWLTFFFLFLPSIFTFGSDES